MLGIAVELLISWILLRALEKQNLSALGLLPNRQRIKDFGAGLLLVVTLMSAWFFTASLLAKNPYRLNDHYTVNQFLSATTYMLRSVAYEELIFRGALLYILIRRIGASRAVWVSAIGFGIYHWFSYGVIGQPVQMLIIFMVTAVGGYVFAVAFKKTQSMYLSFALHLGYNITAMILFSGNKGMGPQLLVKTFEKDPADTSTLVFFLSLFINIVVFPLLVFYFLKRRAKLVNDSPTFQ